MSEVQVTKKIEKVLKLDVDSRSDSLYVLIFDMKCMKHERVSGLLTAPPPQGTPLPPAGAGGQSIVWCGCENTWG